MEIKKQSAAAAEAKVAASAAQVHHLEEIISQMRLAAVELHHTHDDKHHELERDNERMQSLLDAANAQQSNLKKTMQQQRDLWKDQTVQLEQAVSDSKAEAKRAKKENSKLQSEMVNLQNSIKRDSLRMDKRQTQYENRIAALERDLKDARSNIEHQVSGFVVVVVVGGGGGRTS
jgi:chromosome segregation ATPase